MKRMQIAVAVTLVVLGSSALEVARSQQGGVKRTEVQKHELSVPGREVVQAHVDIDPGVEFPKHTHPGEEIVYIIEGELEYQIEGQPTVTLKAGQGLLVPAGAVHAAKNASQENAVALATYIVEQGKPIMVPAAAREGK